jgi:Alkylmercury lyase
MTTLPDLMAIRLAILNLTVETGAVPNANQVAASLGSDRDTVVDGFRQLHDNHVVVLEPQRDDLLRMANPFSAVPTAFRVTVNGRSWWGNCVWDGLGIIACLGGRGSMATACPDCGVEEAVVIEGGTLSAGEGTALIGVPAAHWWDDIVYT